MKELQQNTNEQINRLSKENESLQRELARQQDLFRKMLAEF